ncbi:MAG: hypothetical protein HKN63_10220 [Rhodobacteraceae bacterium]|nr:hypothetical protein [Paracoccaceae bacterium]
MAAEPPSSVIDWLSDSVAQPQQAAAPPLDVGSDIATNASPGDISVTTLDAAMPEAIGVFAPAEAGLPDDLWRASHGDDIAARLPQLSQLRLPALRERLIGMLLVRAAPAAGDADAFLTARVDRLLAMGALPEAEALLRASGPETPEHFRRYFDVALLLGTENEACRLLRSKPDIAPTYPTRIFCLARGGDWAAAAVTLESAETLGILSPAEDMLLARFLDPDITEAAPDPALLRALTPLTFRMLDAIGEPVATGALPIAFAHAELTPNRGWKAQIDAAEELARAGAIAPDILFDAYRQRRPSASGGVWERARAIQELDAALARGNRRKLAAAVTTAWDELSEAGLTWALARAYGPRLAAAGLPGPAGSRAEDLGLMSPDFAEVGQAMRPRTPQRGFLAALASGDPALAPAYDMRSIAIRAGFLGRPLPGPLEQLLDDGRTGEAMLTALALFAQGAEGDPDRISDAIGLLSALGAERIARQAALELLLSPQRP